MFNKKILTILILIVFIIVSFFYRYEIYNSLPLNIKSIAKVLLSNRINTLRINNDYNVKFLPETEFINIDFIKKKININIEKNKSGYVGFLSNETVTFYIDTFQNKLLYLFLDGRIYYSDIKEISLKENFLNQIESNINNINPLDLFIRDKNIYISGSKKIKDNCNQFVILKGDVNLQNINFNEIFNSQKCYKHIQSGRIQSLDKNNLLISTAADILANDDQSDAKPQSNSSIMGKTIIINEYNGSYEIFSKGHRNILGLLVEKDIILSTENGPRGGDEINSLYKGENYGWPISSYGEKYKLFDTKNVHYKKNHEKYGFIEPIYSFVPSIGISEIIKIADNFSKHWKNSYLIASLNSQHLYRIMFDKNFSKIIFLEKIFIGERIRDLNYYKEKNIIFLALESSGSIGIIKIKD